MANTGRDFLIKIAATAIAGAKTTGLSLDNSPIDITSLSSGGFRELDGATLAGDFHVANYNETGSHDNAVEFDATLQSSGTFVLTTAV